ncbi:deoxyribose-phosphate aldolase [Enterococcus pallens]|uniref:Deoxyribose-phosphate aldolase n=1 Tax=Enterococcus pallens ATCC BAA-351 TaxID=1158607 RepID=R2QQI4_9ENTE|nr:deoxyribose-phosphate aldolase [Enterococcus pallens]EOH97458.1 deoxyribose-phosphate aldolase [Enterococcus pallens ATCC BAA-351]EOU21123.1 deoxyribose-phosphate aldolase [Enterococcus pallens ATCC BAA-351]OJG80672.1 deoxyribose-phosphate aldolase [Enterococcus pallens]
MNREFLETMASYFDHSLVKADATKEEVLKFCSEAKEYGFASVVLSSSYCQLCKEALAGTQVHVCCTMAYPLGAMTTATKVFEAHECAKYGADEIDIVMHVGKFLDEDYSYVIADLQAVVQAFKSYGEEKIVKVIIETSIIGNDKISKAVECAIEAGADFVKTSSGYANYGSTVEDVTAMKKAAGDKILVKASGAIRTLEDACTYLEIGAVRLGGTAGIAITEAAKEQLAEEG